MSHWERRTDYSGGAEDAVMEMHRAG